MKLFRWIWTAIKAVVFLTGLSVIGLAVLALALQPWDRDSADVPEGAILDLTWEGRLGEKPVNGNMLQLARGDGLSVFRVMRAIARATNDDRIAGIMIDLSRAEVPLAHAEALAVSMVNFRKSGKPSYAFSSSWDIGRYALGANFGEVWMPDSGEFGVGGLKMMSPYAAELANELGIEAQLEKRKEFKSAADFLLAEGMTPAQRQANNTLLQDIWNSMTAMLGLGREAFSELGNEAVSDRLSESFWNVVAAREQGFIDRLAHRMAFIDAMDGPRIGVRRYMPEVLRLPDNTAGTVAYIAASGTIAEGRTNPLDGDSITDESLIEMLVSASRDPEIDAIILRIDSGGGGFTPSDAILDAIEGIEKPVIASMGSIAGSGGYMIAMAADHIVAHQTTITGSIGVIGGKIVIENLLDDWGVSIDSVQAGPYAGANSPLASYSYAQRQKLIRRIDEIYGTFTGEVARLRDLPPEDVEKAAQGRIWTGNQALELKLIDELGGPYVALLAASKLLNLAEGQSLGVVEYPRYSSSDRIAGVIGLGMRQARIGLGWLASPETVLDRLEDEGGIRAEMPFMLLQ